jgi:hypothetical protein
MTDVFLYTADGRYIVAVVPVPCVVGMVPVEIITWGSRSFLWRAEYRQYREIAAYHVTVP